MIDLVIRRVLVAVDASPSSVEAAAAAAELAARQKAAIEGLFVEDTGLLELGAQPFAALLGGTGVQPGAPELWGPEAVERWIRHQAARARATLEEAARRHGLACELHTARGAVTEEILRRVPEIDVLVMGRVGWSGGRTGRIGRTAAAVLAHSRGVLLPHGSSGERVLRLLLR